MGIRLNSPCAQVIIQTMALYPGQAARGIRFLQSFQRRYPEANVAALVYDGILLDLYVGSRQPHPGKLACAAFLCRLCDAVRVGRFAPLGLWGGRGRLSICRCVAPPPTYKRTNVHKPRNLWVLFPARCVCIPSPLPSPQPPAATFGITRSPPSLRAWV